MGIQKHRTQTYFLSPRHRIICTDTFWSIESISLFKKRRHTLPAISPKEVFQLHLQRRPFQRLQDSDTHTRLGFFPSQKALSFPRNKETGTCRLYHRDQSRHAAMDKRPTLPDACRPSGSMGLFIGSAAGRTQGVAIPPLPDCICRSTQPTKKCLPLLMGRKDRRILRKLVWQRILPGRGKRQGVIFA